MGDGHLGETGVPAEVPQPPDALDRQQVGVDDWVAQAEERREAQTGFAGVVARAWERVPPVGRLVVLLGPFAIFPFFANEGNLFRYGLITLIYALLALGLNIVVGFAGLLDLGYVAFFAVGAYVTALLTSPQSSLGVGWIFWAAVPFVVLAAAVSGLVVGTPVLRMRGDYLAIVTLGFGEIARLLFLSDRLKPTFGGAQGIIRVRDITLGPIEIEGPQAFFYVIF